MFSGLVLAIAVNGKILCDSSNVLTHKKRVKCKIYIIVNRYVSDVSQFLKSKQEDFDPTALN